MAHALLKKDDALLDHMAPHTLLPSQFGNRARSAAERDGTARLMLAVLEDAVHLYVTCATATDRKRRKRFAEVRDWFASTDASWPFAFETVCAALGLDGGCIRRGVRAQLERRVAAPVELPVAQAAPGEPRAA